jgi:hypothetical protein
MAKLWYDKYEEPCLIIKHEEDGSERQLYAWPIPPKDQSYEGYSKRRRIEQIEEHSARITERLHLEEGDDEDEDEDEGENEEEEGDMLSNFTS